MEQLTSVKTGVLATIGITFGWVCNVLGGADGVLMALMILMLIDYFSGIFVALVFKNSPKTESGGASSNAGFKGICKKVMMLLIVLLAYRMDILLGMDYIRSATIMAFLVNEGVSITENAGLMGVPVPLHIKNAIDLLSAKEDKKKEEKAV